jgi:formate C-acetyltransferase
MADLREIEMTIEKLKNELKDYYFRHSFYEECCGKRENYHNPLWDLMDAYAASHPGLSAMQLKTAQYEIIAENFQPVIFRNSPFFSEMSVKIAESNGTAPLSAGCWLFNRNAHLFRDVNPKEYEQYFHADWQGIHLSYGPYVDYDHHCFPFSNVLTNGLGGIYRQAEAELSHCAHPDEREFIECTLRSLLAVKKIAEKFANAADILLKDQTNDETQKRFLRMIAATAGEVPWRKPETFYEGLSTIWFLHEVCASIEGIGMYVLGRLDSMLGELYRNDIDSGRLTIEDAYDLLARFMIYTDCKFDVTKSVNASFNRQELGEVIVLGGCDDEGCEVCNDITFLVLKVHHELKMLYPKIHCRITRNSRQDFLDTINRDFIHGRNVISFLNDEGLIAAQVKAGKKLEDARRYVAGGCWEVMLEGFEHSAGANCYFNLAKIMELSIHEHPKLAETGLTCEKIDEAKDFECVYRIVMNNVIQAIRQMCEVMGRNGSVWPQVNPSPFFSACLADCLKNRRDYTAGGGRYNPHGLPLTNLAVLVDSLLAIKKLCFEGDCHCLSELLSAVRANWDGCELLRAEILTMPHFGDNAEESNLLARRILNEIYVRTRDLKNERGGPFQLGVYSYRDIIDWAKITLATPDGRRAGDYLSQGLTPSRQHKSAEITSAINSAAALDLTKCPASSLMTLSLPLNGINLATLASLERVFAMTGLGMLQLNCVDKAQLLDARVHPECYQDLIVRLYGYSARFVNLTPEMQEEFLSRTIYGVKE